MTLSVEWTLAHALKYTAKMPGNTPERLAECERVLVGIRRYAVRVSCRALCWSVRNAGNQNVLSVRRHCSGSLVLVLSRWQRSRIFRSYQKRSRSIGTTIKTMSFVFTGPRRWRLMRRARRVEAPRPIRGWQALS